MTLVGGWPPSHAPQVTQVASLGSFVQSVSAIRCSARVASVANLAANLVPWPTRDLASHASDFTALPRYPQSRRRTNFPLTTSMLQKRCGSRPTHIVHVNCAQQANDIHLARIASWVPHSSSPALIVAPIRCRPALLVARRPLARSPVNHVMTSRLPQEPARTRACRHLASQVDTPSGSRGHSRISTTPHRAELGSADNLLEQRPPECRPPVG